MTVNPGIETALDVWELTLPEDEAGCESPVGCPSPATWRLTNLCCGASWIVCTEHKRSEEAIVARGATDCVACGASDGRMAWHVI